MSEENLSPDPGTTPDNAACPATPSVAQTPPVKKARRKLGATKALATTKSKLDLSGPVRAARKAPGVRTVIDDELLRVVHAELVKGAWPRELPSLIGAPDIRWRNWLEKGQADAEEGNPSREAELYGLVRRSNLRIQQGYRAGMVKLANEGKNFMVFVRLLSWLSPRDYSERVLEHVEAEVMRLLTIAQSTLSVESYGELVAALEKHRSSNGGSTPLSFTEAAPGMGGYSDTGTDWVPYVQGVTLNATGFIYCTASTTVHCTTKAAGDRTIALGAGYHPVKVTAVISDTVAPAGQLWLVTGPY